MPARLPLAALSALLFTSVALAAACGESHGSPTPQQSGAAPDQTPLPAYTACSPGDPNCQPPAMPTPEALDPAVLSVLARDEFVSSLVGGGELWKDYWLNMSRGTSGTAAVDVVFARPVSFSGTVPTRSQPCKGHAGNDERIDPADPCLQETPVYGTSQFEFRDQRWVQVFVDAGRGGIVEVFVPGITDQSVDELIAYLTKYRPGIATATPAP